MRRLLVSGCVLAFVLMSCSGDEITSGGTLTPGDLQGRIVFAGVGEQGLLNVHTYDFATGEVSNVTNGDLHGNAPVFSADGSRIVFHGVPDGDVEDGNWDIYTVGVDGSNLVRVTSNPELEVFPDWSPDGSRIVFERDRSDGTGRDLFIINADGTGEQRLTGPPGDYGAASWSPDGELIAFSADLDAEPGTCTGTDYGDCNIEIYVMDSDGSNIRRVTDVPSVDGFPDWSPDGTQLAFHSNQADPPWGFDIYTIDVDGSGLTQITLDDTSEGNPSWSPDGQWMVFSSDRNVYEEDPEVAMLERQLYICDTSGNQLAILETGIPDASWPDWTK